jgi:hypothetical protein
VEASETLFVPLAPRPSLPEVLASQTPLLSVAVSATAVLFAVGLGSGQANLSVYAVVMVLGAAAVATLHQRVGLSRLAL